ncbi:hypothetical protein P3S67_015594 [Capsicum chacoense]
MKQAATLKKKVLNPNKAQSPLKNMNSNTQYRSSVELVMEYKIKREQLAKEHNNKIRKAQAPMTHKRKNLEESIAQQGKSILPVNKSMCQSSSREDIIASHIISRKGQIKQRSQVEQEKQHAIKELEDCKQVKRKFVLPSSSLDQFLEKQGIHTSGQKEHDIHTTDGVRVFPAKDLDEHKRLDDPAE